MKCTIVGCNEKVRAGGLCNKHYIQRWKWDHGINIKRSLCENSGCSRMSNSGDICSKCSLKLTALENYMEYRPNYKNRGINNHSWKGGVSDYEDHYTFKKNRLIRIKQEDCKCEICGNDFKYVHHINKDKTNHDLTNLMVLCSKCHAKKHDNLGKPKVYYCGLHIVKLAEKIGISGMSLSKYIKNQNSITRVSVLEKIHKYFFKGY